MSLIRYRLRAIPPLLACESCTQCCTHAIGLILSDRREQRAAQAVFPGIFRSSLPSPLSPRTPLVVAWVVSGPILSYLPKDGFVLIKKRARILSVYLIQSTSGVHQAKSTNSKQPSRFGVTRAERTTLNRSIRPPHKVFVEVAYVRVNCPTYNR